MSELPPKEVGELGPPEKEFYYTVLNLPTTASDYEIRDRYRQLSVLFHPDKQQDERTKETASKRFLEVQKAYQVLSDPVTRQAYDLLGVEGLDLVKGSDFHGLSADEVKRRLFHAKDEKEEQEVQKLLANNGKVIVGVDASSFFSSSGSHLVQESQSVFQALGDRFAGIRQTSFAINHVLQKSFNEFTSFTLTSKASRGYVDAEDLQGLSVRGDVLGTIRHQYSPRINFEASTSLLRPRTLRLKTTYRNENSAINIQTLFSPAILRQFSHVYSPETQSYTIPILPFTFSYSRRLFPTSNVEGTFTVSTFSQIPVVSFTLSSQYLFDRSREADHPSHTSSNSDTVIRPPSRSGLSIGIAYWQLTTSLAGILPALTGELGVKLVELGVQLKSALQLNFGGWNALLSATWSGDRKSAGVDVEVGSTGVILRLELYYLTQRLRLPIVISHKYNEALALWTTVVPSTALVLGYYYVLVPLRHKSRREFFKRLRTDLREAKSDVLRQTEETVRLLQDTARRHMESEASVDGLVILEAWYGPAERDDDTEGLDLNVTIPLQALVNKSQLYIPGRRSKVSKILRFLFLRFE
ncbi:hypothetical protein C8Q75DRAFT_114809 [Abortiporus biennis]|nr:hypothetical protein C8Q75DRAFT_114809 [Abortiporus biennis]